MFRALVTASALLTATLAAVLFMPGVGRDAGQPGRAGGSTGAMLRGGALPGAEVAAVAPDAADAPEAVALPELVRSETVAAAAPDLAGPLADETALAAAVALSAPAVIDEEEAEGALAPLLVEDQAAVEPEPEPVAPAAAAQDDMRSLSQGVLAGLGRALPAEEEPVPAVGAPRRAVSGHSSRQALEAAAGWTTDYVLIGLGKGPRRVTTALEDAQAWSTAYVLNGLGAAGADRRAAQDPVALERVIADAMREGRSDAELIALIDGLSAKGRLDAPAALLRPDGQVDTGLVLNALVHALTRPAGGSASPAPRPARRLAKPVTYTVRPGDSLAAIAFRFYGVTSRYTAIFEANRAALDSPDQIRAGQQLIIPAG